jgi:hypothetical protein
VAPNDVSRYRDYVASIQLQHVGSSVEQALQLEAVRLWAPLDDLVERIAGNVDELLLVSAHYECIVLTRSFLDTTSPAVPVEDVLIVRPRSAEFVWLWHEVLMRFAQADSPDGLPAYAPLIALRDLSCVWAVDLSSREVVCLSSSVDIPPAPAFTRTELFALDSSYSIRTTFIKLLWFRGPRYCSLSDSVEFVRDMDPTCWAVPMLMEEFGDSLESCVRIAAEFAADPRGTYESFQERLRSICLWRGIDNQRFRILDRLYLGNGFAQFWGRHDRRVYAMIEWLEIQLERAQSLCFEQCCAFSISPGEVFRGPIDRKITVNPLLVLTRLLASQWYLEVQESCDPRYCTVDLRRLWPFMQNDGNIVLVEGSTGVVYLSNGLLGLKEEQGRWAAPRQTTVTIWNMWDHLLFSDHRLGDFQRALGGGNLEDS